MPDDRAPRTTEQLPTNLRLVLLMEEVARAGRPLTPAALGQALGLPKPTVHRLLHTAEDEGLLQRHIDGKSYGPGKRMRKLATNILSSERMRTERLAILRVLGDEVGETCNIATPGRDGMFYLERVETHWPLRIQLPIGTEVPFHCTASGKMYLSSLRKDKLDRLLRSLPLPPQTSGTITDPDALKAELQTIHSRGYSTDREEFMDGMVALAVPIKDDQGRLLSALAIHAPMQRHSLDGLTQFLEVMQAAARKLEELVED